MDVVVEEIGSTVDGDVVEDEVVDEEASRLGLGGAECDPSALRSIRSGMRSATHFACSGVAPARTSSDWIRLGL